MTSETIKRIAARYTKQLAHDPSTVDDGLFRSCVSEMARDVAGTFFLGVHHSVETLGLMALSEPEQRKWAALADARAREAAADFAARVRQSLNDAGDTRDSSEIGNFAEAAFIAELQSLAASTDRASGSA